MTRRTSWGPALAAALVLFPAAGLAGTPSPDWSTWPRHVSLVGKDAAGTPDPIGTLDFHVFRVGGTVEYSYGLVVFDLRNAVGIEVNPQQSSGVEAYCLEGTSYVRAFLDEHGRARFSVVGRADRALGGSHAPSLSVSVDGVLFGVIPVSAFDQDGNGLGPADHSLWLTDYFSSQYWERADFDGDGALGPADLSRWLTAFFGDGSILNGPGTACP